MSATYLSSHCHPCDGLLSLLPLSFLQRGSYWAGLQLTVFLVCFLSTGVADRHQHAQLLLMCGRRKDRAVYKDATAFSLMLTV